MDQKNETNLDSEFRRYLQILRPHLIQLRDQHVIDICNAWIQKLSACGENEKTLRNKYIFALCYQLSKGVLDEPFLKAPPSQALPPLQDDNSSDGSFNEVECFVIDSESANTKLLYDRKSPSQVFTECNRIDEYRNRPTSHSNCDLSASHRENLHQSRCESPVPPYSHPAQDFIKCNECHENYYFRANNLIMKLREIKKQNVFLQNELQYLKEESGKKREIDDLIEDSILKIDNATITYNSNRESNTTLTSLKCKLQEIQCSRNNLIETVGSLQDKLDHFDEMKKHEIDEITAKHKLETIQLKTSIREEVKTNYEIKLEALKTNYEDIILKMQESAKEEMENLQKNAEKVIFDKDKLLQFKEDEICQLKQQLEELKSQQVSVLNKFIDYSNEYSNGSFKFKSHDLERRLNRMEKTKNRCAKLYEAKIASLQREKHLAECSLQMQLIKQRAQMVNETTDENQVELNSALEKLENKYKEIVANMQATAVQRRLQDQIALESLIKAVCGIENENPCPNQTTQNTGHSSAKTNRNQNKEINPNHDRQNETLCNSNRADNVFVGNTSFGEESVVTGYCLDSNKLQELFNRIHIPQRDVGDLPK